MRGAAAVLLLVLSLAAADFPQAEISSGPIKARLYLPDAQHGYYQGTRFDWSGQIRSLTYDGHEFFGQWFEKYDPKIHDAIMGPVEEFLTNDAGLGYAEAKPGENFVRIGVGAVRKPDESAYRRFATYEITDAGKWDVVRGPDFVEFTQTLSDTNGYAYVYRKRVVLAKDEPVLRLEHSLRNTGRKRIESTVYEHNFYMLDHRPSGPEFVVFFPFNVHAKADLKGFAETAGRELRYVKELPNGESIFSELTGYRPGPGDYKICVENRAARIGVCQSSQQPIAKLNFWSIRSTVCPEAFIDMRIEPGKEFTWTISYVFYHTPK